MELLDIWRENTLHTELTTVLILFQHILPNSTDWVGASIFYLVKCKALSIFHDLHLHVFKLESNGDGGVTEDLFVRRNQITEMS